MRRLICVLLLVLAGCGSGVSSKPDQASHCPPIWPKDAQTPVTALYVYPVNC